MRVTIQIKIQNTENPGTNIWILMVTQHTHNKYPEQDGR